MATQIFDLEKERVEILNAYKGLLQASKEFRKTTKDTQIIRKAFDIAVEAHKDDRRKSGEPYIFHPIAVARICAEEMGRHSLWVKGVPKYLSNPISKTPRGSSLFQSIS